jgi:hypothetical protein
MRARERHNPRSDESANGCGATVGGVNKQTEDRRCDVSKVLGGRCGGGSDVVTLMGPLMTSKRTPRSEGKTPESATLGENFESATRMRSTIERAAKSHLAARFDGRRTNPSAAEFKNSNVGVAATASKSDGAAAAPDAKAAQAARLRAQQRDWAVTGDQKVRKGGGFNRVISLSDFQGCNVEEGGGSSEEGRGFFFSFCRRGREGAGGDEVGEEGRNVAVENVVQRGLGQKCCEAVADDWRSTIRSGQDCF